MACNNAAFRLATIIQGGIMKDTPYFEIFRDVLGVMGLSDDWGNVIDGAVAISKKYAATEYRSFVDVLLRNAIEELQRTSG